MNWQDLRFGVEIEFVGGDPAALVLLPGWKMALNELQVDEQGNGSGGELTPPPLQWQAQDQIRTMLDRLRAQGAQANWSCGTHVHVGIEPWGEPLVPRLLQAALDCQAGFQALVQTAPHRTIFCPPVVPEMIERFAGRPERPSLVHRPQSNRCGINAAAWFDVQTVEFRYANGSLDFNAIVQTVELCLRFVAAVGRGGRLPNEPVALAAALGATTSGYPAPTPAPLWHWERIWFEQALLPVLAPQVADFMPGGEILTIRPTADGIRVTVEDQDETTIMLLYADPAACRLHR
jgi:hypothetical protein